MTTIVELPDGSSVEVPTDDPQAAAAAARQYWTSKGGELPDPAPNPRRTGLQTVGDFFGDVVDNFTPNWGDELLGGIPAAIGSLGTDEGMGAAFDRGQAEFKANQAEYDAEHPNLAWASTLGGMGAGLLLPGGAAVKGAGMGSKIWQGAKIGGAYGALSGAGEGEGLAERAENALGSAATGFAVGGAFAPAVEGLVRGHRVLKNALPGYDEAARRLHNAYRFSRRQPGQSRQARAAEQADRVLAQRMQEGNILTGMGQTGAAASPETIAAELERRAAMGVPAMPADMTDSLRGAAGRWSRGMGPGQALVRQRLDERKALEALRVRQHIVDTLGEVTDPLSQIEAQTAAAKARVRPLYDEAYSQTSVLTPEIEQIMQTPAFQDALPIAHRNIRNAKGNPEALGLRLRSDGTIDPEAVRTLSPEGFDQVIRAMRDNSRAAAGTNALTGKPIHNSNSVHIGARASELGDQLAAQNPAYADLRRLYADDMASIEAMESGKNIANLTGHEVNAMSRSIPEAAHESFALGARTALADDASLWGAKHPTGNTAARVRGALGDQTKQDALGGMMGNNGGIRRLQDRLEAEHQGNVLYAEARGGSSTARNQAGDADVDGRDGTSIPTTLRDIVSRGMGLASRHWNGQRRNDIGERMGQVLTETDPTAFRSHLDDIKSVGERDAQAAVARSARANLLAKAYALNIAPTREDGKVLIGYDFNDSGRPYGQYGRYEDNFDKDGNRLP